MNAPYYSFFLHYQPFFSLLFNIDSGLKKARFINFNREAAWCSQ